jgi:outer membrane receptor protein involved in Fe transport
VLSAGVDLGPRQNLRLLLRVDDSTVGTPGPTAYGRPDLDASFDATNIAAGATFRRAGTTVVHEARASFAQSDQLTSNPLDSGSFVPTWEGVEAPFPYSDFADPAGFQNDTTRSSFGYQAEIRAGRRNLLTAGADLEHESGALGSRSGPLMEPTRTNVGFFAQDRFVLGGLFATLGARVEHNESFGTKVVPRLALAYRARGGEDATTLRGSAGAGIKEPDFYQSFSDSPFALGNPDLEPEKSRTFDLGIDQRLFHGRAQATLTYFHQDYRDQIAYEYDFASGTGTYINLGESRAQGLEAAVAAVPVPRLTVSAEYTYLDGEIQASNSLSPVYAVGEPLLRRPKHQGSVSARYGDERFSIGASVISVGERADSDFVGLGLTRNEAYTRVDARVHARIARGFSAFLVAENLFDAEYQEVLGYPALGRSVRFGLRFRSQDARRP